jgi:hypothetical protein
MLEQTTMLLIGQSKSATVADLAPENSKKFGEEWGRGRSTIQ